MGPGGQSEVFCLSLSLASLFASSGSFFSFLPKGSSVWPSFLSSHKQPGPKETDFGRRAGEPTRGVLERLERAWRSPVGCGHFVVEKARLDAGFKGRPEGKTHMLGVPQERHGHLR